MSLGMAGKIDEESFKNDIRKLITELQRSSLKDVRVGLIIEEMLETAVKYKIKLPLDFVLFAKAIVTLEGLGLKYHPDFRVLTHSKPILNRIIRKRYSPKKLLKKATRR